MPNQVVDQTIATVTAATTVIESATTLIQSIPSMIDAAKIEAIANGATAEQLAPFALLNTELQAKADALAAAITANTPHA